MGWTLRARAPCAQGAATVCAGKPTGCTGSGRTGPEPAAFGGGAATFRAPGAQSVATVLRPGGALLAGFTNPVLCLFDDEKMEQGEFVVRHTIPYSDLTSLTDVERRRYTDKNEPLCFGHTLADQIGGQLDAGFRLTGFYEDGGESWRKLKQTGPSADWEVYPTTPWNYALALDSFQAKGNPVAKQPFDPATPAIGIVAKARRLPEWQLENDSAGELPVSPVTSSRSEENITLIPYGAGKLRITAFPYYSEKR